MNIKEQVAELILDCVKANEQAFGFGLSENSPLILANQIHSLYEQAGYKSPEQIKKMVEGMKELKFNQSETLGLIPAQALIDYDRAKEVLGKVAQAQLQACKEQILKEIEK